MPYALSIFASLLCAIVFDMRRWIMLWKKARILSNDRFPIPILYPIGSRNDAFTVIPACSYYPISCNNFLNTGRHSAIPMRLPQHPIRRRAKNYEFYQSEQISNGHGHGLTANNAVPE
jgi:hypothetical protein